MSIETEIERLVTAKSDLKAAINAKGGSLTDQSISAYAAAVAALATGGGYTITSGIAYLSRSNPYIQGIMSEPTGIFMQHYGNAASSVNTTSIISICKIPGQAEIKCEEVVYLINGGSSSDVICGLYNTDDISIMYDSVGYALYLNRNSGDFAAGNWNYIFLFDKSGG